jgi:hypothetical protein
MDSTNPRTWSCPTCGDEDFFSYSAFMRHRRMCARSHAVHDDVEMTHEAFDSDSNEPGNDAVAFNDNQPPGGLHENDIEELLLEDDVNAGDVVVPVLQAHEQNIDDDEFSEDIALFVNDRATLRFRTKFMRWGLAGAGGETMHGAAGSYNAAQLVTLRFLQTLETGDPMSLLRQQGILSNARKMGGRALLMHPDIHKHWEFVENAHERLTQKRGRRSTCFPVPLEVQALLGPNPPVEIPFSCEDVMLTLIRLLVLNPFNDIDNIQLAYEESDYYDDYCTGERWKRVLEALLPGRYALFFTLFIDGLQQDKGGFVTAKGCVMTMANFRWYLRGASSSKAGICVFPDVDVPKGNRGKRCVVAFKKQLFHDCIAFMLLPAHEFNARGGVCLPLNSTCYHFERVVLLALITDAPEGRDLGGTIAACHHCFCPVQNMGDVEAATEPRTTVSMASAMDRLNAVIRARVHGTVGDARDEAKKMGLSLDLRNGFDTPIWAALGIFGPDELLDHIHGALPQGMLHGLHEGLVKYVIRAILHTVIASCVRRDVFKLTPLGYVRARGAKDVRDGNRKLALDYIDDALREFARSNARCSDLELNCIGIWKYFATGVAEGLVGESDKRLNGMFYWPMLRQIHVALASSNLLTKNEKIQLFGTCDLCYQVIEFVHNPVPKGNNGGQNFQDVATEFTRQLILCWIPFSASKCQSIKWHLILHWLWYLKQMGGFSDERTLEKELGILFKKPYKMTNHHADHNDQMAMRTSLKQVCLLPCTSCPVLKS